MKPGLAQFHNLGQNRVSSNAAYYLVPMIYNAILMLVCVVDGVKAINSSQESQKWTSSSVLSPQQSPGTHLYKNRRLIAYM